MLIPTAEVARTPKVDRRWYLREDAQQSIRDYSIGGSCPQHIESSQESGPHVPPWRHPIAPGAPGPAEGAGSSPLRPEQDRNTNRIDPRRTASVSGNNRRGWLTRVE